MVAFSSAETSIAFAFFFLLASSFALCTGQSFFVWPTPEIGLLQPKQSL